MRPYYLPALAVLAGAGWLLQNRATPAAPDAIVIQPQKRVELAPYMAEMQRLSFKLGRALEAQNGPLSEFYREELEEALDRLVREVPAYDGLPISSMAKARLEIAIGRVEMPIARGDWTAASDKYRALIAGCNACHTDAHRGFVKIVAGAGDYLNQDFQRQ